MDKSRMQVAPGVWLDARRCIFLEESRVLAVSDLHIGYAWAHRFGGQLLPLQPDGVRERLAALCVSYEPRILVLLGDIVHRSVPVAEVRNDLVELMVSLRQKCELVLVAGNHDKRLARLFPSSLQASFIDRFICGQNLFVHGDGHFEIEMSERVIMGHEHPAVSLGDGVRSAKFPCFLVGPRLIVLPAFSRWAAGADVRAGGLMSPAARSVDLKQAVAIMNDKLLPVALR